MKLLYTLLLVCGSSLCFAQCDLAIATPDSNGATHLEQGAFFRMGNNRYSSPPNFTTGNPMSWWGARVVNLGNQLVTNLEQPLLRCRISYYDSTAMLRQVIHRDSILMGAQDTLAVGDSIGVVFKALFDRDDIAAILYRPNYSQQERVLLVEHWIESQLVDVDPSNDTLQYELTMKKRTRNFISSPTFSSAYNNYVSKAECSPVDGRVQAVAAYLPDATNLQLFECGALFYFESHGFDSMTVDSIDFRYYLDSSFVGDSVQNLYFMVYEFQDYPNPTGRIQGSSLTMTSLGVVTLRGLGTTIAPGTYNLATCTNMVDAATGGTAPPLAIFGNYCYISVAIAPYYTADSTNPFIPVHPTTTPMFGMDRVNYGLNMHESAENTPFAACHWLEVDSFSRRRGDHVGAVDLIPALGVFYQQPQYYIANKQLPSKTSFQVQLFPNPTTDYLQVQLLMTRPLQAPLQYVVTDATGRVVYYRKEEIALSYLHTILVRDLPAGVYHLHLKSGDQQTSKAFVVAP